PIGESQRQHSCCAGHDDVAVAAHRAEEALELELQRLRLGGVEPDVLDDLLNAGGTEPLPPRLEPVEVAVALRQIEREVAGRLEDAQLARALARHAARRD